MNRAHLPEDQDQENYRKESFQAFTNCCGLIIGVKRDIGNLLITLLLIIGLMIIYFAFIFPLAIRQGYIILNTLCIVYGCSPLITLFNTIMTEPGVLIRSNKSEESYVKPQSFHSGQENSILIQDDEKEKDESTPRIYQERYCKTCKIMRPPKASHCRYCNHCVAGFDHHCFWIGACIGIRNWRAFTIFLTTASSAPLVAGFLSLLVLSNKFDQSLQLLTLMLQEANIYIISFYALSFICCYWTYKTFCNLFFLTIITLGLLIHSYQILQSQEDLSKQQYYENPIATLVVGLIYILVSLMVSVIALTNWQNAAQMKTSKQLNSEWQFYQGTSKQNEQITLTYRQQVENLKKFLTYDIPQSKM